MTHHHGHHHQHHAPLTFDAAMWADRAGDLARDGELLLDLLDETLAWVAPMRGDALVRTVLDVGAGPGVLSVALARHFSDAVVTAVDSAGPLLAHATARAGRLGVAERLQTAATDLEGDLGGLPEADLILASRVLHHVGDPVGVMRRLGARLRPGGCLMVVEGGLPLRWLPEEAGVGRYGLAARLEAAWATALGERLAHHHAPGVPRPTLDWGAMIAEAGLARTTARTFLQDHPAPVSSAVRAHLIDRVERMRELAEPTLDADDAEALAALLDPAHPLGLHRRPDLFLLTASTVHVGLRDVDQATLDPLNPSR